MTKEDIINELEGTSDGWQTTFTYNEVEKAMYEYAKQQSIDFLKWYAIKMIGFLQYLKDVKPTITSNEIEEKIKEFEGKPIEELHQLFITNQSKQQ